MSQNLMIIGISGASGSGKSLLSKTIVEELGSDQVTIISEDSYYKDLSGMPMQERNKVNFDHPDAFDHSLLAQQLQMLKDRKAIDVPIYDYKTHNRTSEARHISNTHSIIVVEGILLFVDPQIRELMDIRIYVDTPLDTCFIRRLERDVIERARTMESVVTQYQSTVRPMFVKFIEPSKRYADIIVPHGGRNRIAIEIIKAKMKELIQNAARG